MGIFSSKKNTEKKEVAAPNTAKESFAAYESDVLIAPHITEKAGVKAGEENVYTFNVLRTATKPSIKKAIEAIYKVTPTKIATITTPGKKVFVRGKYGITKATKKALVYLKKGDKIEFV